MLGSLRLNQGPLKKWTELWKHQNYWLYLCKNNSRPLISPNIFISQLSPVCNLGAWWAILIQCSVPFGDLHCQCIFSIFPAGAHQLKCKHTCIEKCRPDFLSTQDFNEEMIKKSSNIEKCQSVSLWHDQFALVDTFSFWFCCDKKPTVLERFQDYIF